MRADFLKIARVKNDKEFYSKYPTEESFFEAHPEASHMRKGGAVSTEEEFFDFGLIPTTPQAFYEQGGDFCADCAKQSDTSVPEMKKGGHWIQDATKNMRKDKPCTGDKFGSKTCPPGSKRYNLAKTFKAMVKKEDGGDTNEITEDELLNRKLQTVLGFIKNNTMSNIAEQESEKLYYQTGGDFGFQENAQQNMFQDKLKEFNSFDIRNSSMKCGGMKRAQDGTNIGSTNWMTTPTNPEIQAPVYPPEIVDPIYTTPYDPEYYQPPTQGTDNKGINPEGQELVPEDKKKSPFKMSSGPGGAQAPNNSPIKPGHDKTIASINAWTNLFNSDERKATEKKIESLYGADKNFIAVDPNRGYWGQTGSYTGAFEPQRMTPVQFSGMSYKQGGEYDLSDAEIAYILKNGGQIEYLD